MLRPDPKQHLPQLAAMNPPADPRLALEFERLRDQAAQHLAGDVPSLTDHKVLAGAIRVFLDAGEKLEKAGDARGSIYRRHFVPLLGVVRDACGALCCPADAFEHPDVRDRPSPRRTPGVTSACFGRTPSHHAGRTWPRSHGRRAS
jgi:hypothetical protein